MIGCGTHSFKHSRKGFVACSYSLLWPPIEQKKRQETPNVDTLFGEKARMVLNNCAIWSDLFWHALEKKLEFIVWLVVWHACIVLGFWHAFLRDTFLGLRPIYPIDCNRRNPSCMQWLDSKKVCLHSASSATTSAALALAGHKRSRYPNSCWLAIQKKLWQLGGIRLANGTGWVPWDTAVPCNTMCPGSKSFSKGGGSNLRRQPCGDPPNWSGWCSPQQSAAWALWLAPCPR